MVTPGWLLAAPEMHGEVNNGTNVGAQAMASRASEWDVLDTINYVKTIYNVDASRIYLVGFGMGGMVATFTAALDERVAATVSISGFTPFRSDNDAAGDGGIRRWSHLYGWLPRLGQFVGNESAVPVDFPDVLSAIAPRRMLVVAPMLDWHHPHANVVQAIEGAKAAYTAHKASGNLQLYDPMGLADFSSDVQSHVIQFLSGP
jgi:pimeloyl-ACP methyl ester carboxylesterase